MHVELHAHALMDERQGLTMCSAIVCVCCHWEVRYLADCPPVGMHAWVWYGPEEGMPLHAAPCQQPHAEIPRFQQPPALARITVVYTNGQ